MIYIYKYLKGDIITDQNLFVMANNTKTRGHSMKIYKQQCNTNLRRNVFTQRAIDNWNGLSQEVVDSPSVNCFKSRLDIFWRNAPILFDYKECVNL